MMRNWFKKIIFECLQEVTKDQPLIIACRPPTENDVYCKNTHWISGNKKWVCKKVSAEWEEIE